MAGDLIVKFVNRVLNSHQMDLKVFGVLEKMQKSSQPECNYLHTAGVLFDPIKDAVSQQTLRSAVQQPVQPQSKNFVN